MKSEAADRIRGILESARFDGRDALLEPEGLAVLEAMELEIPVHLFVRGSAETGNVELSRLPGDRVAVKVVSVEILHKSDVGGVATVPKHPERIVQAIRDMETRFAAKRVAGYTISQFIEYEKSLGSELLAGIRWTDDFGPVVTFGPGGIYTEFLAANLRQDRSVAIVSPRLTGHGEIEAAIGGLAVTRILSGGMRGQENRISARKIAAVIERFLSLACTFMPDEIAEFEVNPLVVSAGRLVALDVLLKMASHKRPAPPPSRPIHKIRRLLEPSSAAVIGVSEKMNPGHVIVNNLLREGFPKDRISIVKPGNATIEGCRCYPDIESLPEPVDLFVLAIPAAQVAGALLEIIGRKKAEAVIVIPGGLEEKEGGAAQLQRVREALSSSRHTAWEGPVINGGNCLGIRSVPGRYDTMFIPQYKLCERRGDRASPVALISQSGAFALSKANKLSGITPKYTVSIGNQMDLTIGDYMEYLRDDSEIQVFAVYVEGFKPLDGMKFLEASREITRGGRTVILYRAGRTAEGARATASHTASIAGDYAVTRALAASAGIVLVEAVDDFEDLVRLFALLGDRSVNGRGLGGVSNAGFECVAVADNVGSLRLVQLGESTAARLRDIFCEARIEQLVDVHNPVDLTPIAGDRSYEAAFRAVMRDDAVDVGLLGIVPLTPALNTLPPGPGHSEDHQRTDSILSGALRLKQEIAKAWVAVVDAGPAYDALARRLEEGCIPVFRTADRALRVLNLFCVERLRTQHLKD
jgi:acyl-CoA synthetase (NDP forming)